MAVTGAELVAAHRAARRAHRCSQWSTRCKDARKYDVALAECCRTHVIRISRVVAEAFREAGVRFWADYGTLLGAVRNPLTSAADYPWLDLPDAPIAPGIIPHDKDADWGAMMDDWQLAVRAIRQVERKHRFSALYRANNGSIKVRLSRVNHTNLDIFFWHEEADGLLHRRYYVEHLDRFKGREFRPDMLYPMGSVQWEGLSLPAPRDPEAFCEMRYGAGWRTPIAANNDGIER